MSTFSVDISIQSSDVIHLKEQLYTLYILKAFIDEGDRAPLVWGKIPPIELLTTNQIEWDCQLTGIRSDQRIVENEVIHVGASTVVELGQKITLKTNGNFENGPNGTPYSVTFVNDTSEGFTVGLSQAINGQNNPFCVSSLPGNNGITTLTPLPAIALIFAPEQIDISSVITKSMSKGVLVSLRHTNNRKLTYSIVGGWKATDGMEALLHFPPMVNFQEMLGKITNDL